MKLRMKPRCPQLIVPAWRDALVIETLAFPAQCDSPSARQLRVWSTVTRLPTTNAHCFARLAQCFGCARKQIPAVHFRIMDDGISLGALKFYRIILLTLLLSLFRSTSRQLSQESRRPNLCTDLEEAAVVSPTLCSITLMAPARLTRS